MQSILLISKNKEKIEEKIKHITKGVNPIDVNFLDYELNPLDTKVAKNSIGIKEVRDFQKKLYLKPLKSEFKTLILKHCHQLTIEAQNALLKVLEEPPNNTIIILTATTINNFLPTILSRCKIIDAREKGIELTEQEVSQYLNILISLISSRVGERLKIAQDLSKNKDEAILWLEKMILSLRQTLLFSVGNKRLSSDINFSSLTSHLSFSQYINLLISFNRTRTILSTTNANPRLILENLLLNL